MWVRDALTAVDPRGNDLQGGWRGGMFGCAAGQEVKPTSEAELAYPSCLIMYLFHSALIHALLLHAPAFVTRGPQARSPPPTPR